MKKMIQKTTFHPLADDRQNETVQCAACHKTIGLRDGRSNGATGLGWFDPYADEVWDLLSEGQTGAYVHHACISERRKKEMAQ